MAIADLVLTGGKVATVDKDFSFCEAVAVKDGRIAGIGKAETILHRDFLREVYDMDVAGYMLDALKKWEQVL